MNLLIKLVALVEFKLIPKQTKTVLRHYPYLHIYIMNKETKWSYYLGLEVLGERENRRGVDCEDVSPLLEEKVGEGVGHSERSKEKADPGR